MSSSSSSDSEGMVTLDSKRGVKILSFRRSLKMDEDEVAIPVKKGLIKIARVSSEMSFASILPSSTTKTSAI